MTLGEYIKNKRLEKNLSMQKLAELSNISNWQNIQKYEKDIAEPTATNLFKLINILEIDINELKKIILKQDI